jgi:signal transduction histidine kinase/CheY-like chemotaxis protein
MSTPPELQDQQPGPGPRLSAFPALAALLSSENPGTPSLDALLASLACTFACEAAGFACLLGDVPVLTCCVRADGSPCVPPCYPWAGRPELLRDLRAARSAVPAETAEGKAFLASATTLQEGTAAVLWLQGAAGRVWLAQEKDELTLALLALARHVTTPPETAAWTGWLEQVRRRRALEATATVVGRLSHDFSNILTGILGFTELSLGQLAPDASCKPYLNEVHQAALQGTKLVGRLSQLSRRGSQPVVPAPLAPLVAEAAARVREARGGAVQLESDVSAKLPPLAISAEALRQVLGLLIDNACEAIVGTGIITVAARTTRLGADDCLQLLGDPSAGEHVEVTVTDTGCGLTPEARRRVLAEPFFSTKPRHKGYGLPLVYALLQNHRGSLRLDGGADGGTTVRFYLPVSGCTVRIRRPAVTTAPAGERLLVVDDDPMTLQIMCTTLEQAGYRVQPAADGDQALDSYTSAGEPFRLVLSDVVMPRMTGFDLARRLLDRDPHVNVLFTSGFPPAGSLPEGAGGRRFDLLPKPFRPESLLRAVRTALAARGDRPGAAVGRTEN